MKRVAFDIIRRRAVQDTPKSLQTIKEKQRFSLLTKSKVAQRSLHTSIRSSTATFQTQLRQFSSPAAPSATGSTTTQATTKKKADSNIFFDNLGKIFLVVIAGIVATLVRSSRSTVNRNTIRDAIEESSVIDPVEIDELRLANSELQPEVYRTIMRELVDSYPQGTCSYLEFTLVTRKVMAGLKGGAFTIQLGHLVDRVVLEVLVKYQKSEADPFPLALWAATLSLSLNSSVDERMEVLFEALEKVGSGSPVTVKEVEEVVGHLQDTCQLPPETQIVPTTEKFPTQQWVRGSPEELVPWDGSKNEIVDFDAFQSILRTKSVCAWGECYHKRK